MRMETSKMLMKFFSGICSKKATEVTEENSFGKSKIRTVESHVL